MPKREITIEMTRGRLSIPGDSEWFRISDVVTEAGPRALVEILAPGRSGGGHALAGATFDRAQTEEIVNGLLLLLSNFLGAD